MSPKSRVGRSCHGVRSREGRVVVKGSKLPEGYLISRADRLGNMRAMARGRPAEGVRPGGNGKVLETGPRLIHDGAVEHLRDRMVGHSNKLEAVREAAGDGLLRWRKDA